MDSNISYNYIVNLALDVVARKRYIYSIFNIAGFTQIRAVFNLIIIFHDDLLGNLVRFEFFIIILALFLLLYNGFL